MYGTLIPLGGGDPIPLPNPELKPKLLIGRRESCDIVLRFANVSAHHCQLFLDSGYWYVRDMQSSNGVRINDIKLERGSTHRLDPGDVLSVAKHKYRVEYEPVELGAVGPPPVDNLSQEIMGESLLSRAGLDHREFERPRSQRRSEGRYDPTNNQAGQIKLPDEPV
jgi:predicted component of type VI protein secretion system